MKLAIKTTKIWSVLHIISVTSKKETPQMIRFYHHFGSPISVMVPILQNLEDPIPLYDLDAVLRHVLLKENNKDESIYFYLS